MLCTVTLSLSLHKFRRRRSCFSLCYWWNGSLDRSSFVQPVAQKWYLWESWSVVIHLVLGKAWGFQTTGFQVKVIVPHTWSPAYTVALFIFYFSLVFLLSPPLLSYSLRTRTLKETGWATANPPGDKVQVPCLCSVLVRTSSCKASTESQFVLY